MRAAKTALRWIQSDALIARVSAKGSGVAKVDDLPPIQLKHAIPGQTVHLSVDRVKQGRLKINSVEVVKPSESEVPARCKLFTRCNGCIWQNADYASQLRWKEDIFQSLMLDSRTTAPCFPMKASPEVYHYRSKFEFTISEKLFVFRDDPKHKLFQSFTSQSRKEYEAAFPDFACGLFPGGAVFDKIVGVDYCHLIPEVGNVVYRSALAALRKLWKGPEVPRHLMSLILRFARDASDAACPIQTMVQLETRALEPPAVLQSFPSLLLEALDPSLRSSVRSIVTLPNTIQSRIRMSEALKGAGATARSPSESPQSSGPHPSQFRNYHHVQVLHGQPFLHHRLGPLSIRVSPASFLQPNLYQMDALYQSISDALRLGKNQVVWDLFCGTGTIGLFLASQVKSVIGVDIVETAIEDARENAQRNGIANAQFRCLDLLNLQGLLDLRLPEPDVVIVDPNRPGLGKALCDLLLELHPEKICYVSCNPESQKLDLMRLTKQYKILMHQPVDMLPHTHHIENIALLQSLT